MHEWFVENTPLLKKVAQDLWQYAEIGLKEKKSANLLATICREHGFHVEMGIAGMPTAFLAKWGKGKPAIAYLAEYDALPGLSQKASGVQESIIKDGAGHGCGHNLLGAGALGAALALKAKLAQSNQEGSVYLLGCPAEETINAKGYMVREGYLDSLDAVFDWHPDDINAVMLGSSLACYSLKYEFYGRAAHAACNPAWGRSALDAVELMNVGVNYLREHVPPETRMHYVITSGGGEPNVVPAFASVWYYLRAPLRSEVEDLCHRVELCARGAALMTETEAKVTFLDGGYGLGVNKTLSVILHEELMAAGPPRMNQEVQPLLEELISSIPAQHIRDAKTRIGLNPDHASTMHSCVAEPQGESQIIPGSSDVGDVSKKIPTAQLSMACLPLGIPLHSWQAVAAFGSEAGMAGMLQAARVLAGAGWQVIQKPHILKRAWQEHNEKLKVEPYTPILTAHMQPPLTQWE